VTRTDGHEFGDRLEVTPKGNVFIGSVSSAPRRREIIEFWQLKRTGNKNTTMVAESSSKEVRACRSGDCNLRT
jgi:hypothetical protein